MSYYTSSSFTSEPAHDAAMHDIYCREESELTSEEEERYPYCDICGERILLGEEYFEFEGFYFHRDCISFSDMEER